MHEWQLDLAWNDGRPVTDAEIAISGGMPQHNHGMPTDMHISPGSQPGQYLVEGIRFHMMGNWEITLVIEAEGITDTLTIRLEL